MNKDEITSRSREWPASAIQMPDAIRLQANKRRSLRQCYETEPSCSVSQEMAFEQMAEARHTLAGVGR